MAGSLNLEAGTASRLKSPIFSVTVEALHKEGVFFRNDVAVPEWPLWLAESLLGSALTASKRGPSMIWPLVI